MERELIEWDRFTQICEKSCLAKFLPILQKYANPKNTKFISHHIYTVISRWITTEQYHRLSYIMNECDFWKSDFFHGFVSEREAEILLEGKECGTYLISATCDISHVKVYFVTEESDLSSLEQDIVLTYGHPEHGWHWFSHEGETSCVFQEIFESCKKAVNLKRGLVRVPSENPLSERTKIPSLRAMCVASIWKLYDYHAQLVQKAIVPFDQEIFTTITLKEVFHEKWYPMTEDQFEDFQIAFKPHFIRCQSLGCGVDMDLYDEEDENQYLGLCYHESFCERCYRAMCPGCKHGLSEVSCDLCGERFCWNCVGFTFDCSKSGWWSFYRKILCDPKCYEESEQSEESEEDVTFQFF